MGLLCNEKVENLLMNSTIMDFPKYPSSSSSSSPSSTITKRAHNDDDQDHPEPLDCPRCGSKNTKFCYYNNYNKSQPRYFCKACKRHWTKGGMLRNVPVGGCRKNKRLKTSGDNNGLDISTAAAAVVVDTVVAGLNNSVMMYDRDCHHLYLGDQEGLKAFNEDDQKSISSLVLDAFMDNTSNLNFSFSGIDSLSFDINGGGGGSGNQASSISSIRENKDVYYYDQCSNNSQLESLESSSTITTTNQYNGVCYPPWKSGDTVVVDKIADYWDLNDLDALISTDINVPWDDDYNGVINP